MATKGRYRVYVITDNPPIYYDKAYSFMGAVTFARMGTKRRKDGSKAGDRAVSRGLGGPLVRVYSDSQRMWPLYAEQVNDLSDQDALTKREIPKQLVVGGKYKKVRLEKRGNRWYASNE